MMSVLVPSFPSSSKPNYFSHHRINGNLSQSTKHLSLINDDNNNNNEQDHVPYGVVNSMKQRFLDKINESLILTRQTLTKSSNENLFQLKSSITSPLKQTTRLSRSQDNLLNNHHSTEQFTTYLQPKQNLIIVDTTTSNDENNSIQRQSYVELHIDEVPKPGTVTTVKNMFERQIRLSRYDSEKITNTPISTNLRINNQNRSVRSPNRSRSISPNDMALRQRRTTTQILPSTTSYPDLVISHTPSEINKINPEQIQTNEMTTNDRNSTRPNLSSDTDNYQPLDFKSRLALFKERSNEEKSKKKSSNHFLTKPMIHHNHNQIEKKENPSIINTNKSITFFGGTKINGITKSIPIPITIDEQSSNIDFIHVPDVIGGNVKLNKSSIFSGMKKSVRVQFIDDVNTYEYPSFTIIMAEHGITDSNDDDDDIDEMNNIKKSTIDENLNDIDDDELEQLAHINARYNSSSSTERPLEPKGSLHTFRPTHLDQYELGTQHSSILSDIYSREKSVTLSENFSNYTILKQDKTNNIPWSSMSTTTDLLF